MLIKIPCSAPRRPSWNNPVFAKLLNRVDIEDSSGFGFEGVFLKPGAAIEEARLWPAPDYPKVPIVLECAGTTGRNPTGQRVGGSNKARTLYLLWRYDGEGRWTELGRAASLSWEWAIDLGPIAVRAVEGQRAPEPTPSIEDVMLRITTVLDQELARCEPPDRARVLCSLHDQFAWRITAK